MRLPVTYLMALIVIANNAIAWAQDFNILDAKEDEREKRAIDFGQFVRNLLLNSAAASNVKSDIARNVINLKATTIAPRRRTTTSTTTTKAPFTFNKGPLKFPFDLSAPFNNKINFNNNKLNSNNGYINFDYNDYGVRQTVRPGRRRRPTTTTTTTTTRAPRPPPSTQRSQQPIRRKPIPRRPYGLFGKQKVPQFEYYNDDDYNYNYEDDEDDDTEEANTTTSAPATRRPPPPPPPARPQRPPTAARARAQGRIPQLRNRFVYQFRQPEDISTNNNNDNAQPPATDSTAITNNDDNDEDYQTGDANNNDTGNKQETSVNTNDDYTDIKAGDNANNNAQDDNIDPNNASDDNSNNSNPLPNDFNLPFSPLQAQNQFNTANENYVPNIGNFGPSAGFQYPSYNDYGTQYQASQPAAYSIRYY